MELRGDSALPITKLPVGIQTTVDCDSMKARISVVVRDPNYRPVIVP